MIERKRLRKGPLVLAILDGWGQRDDVYGNAVATADLPNWRRILATYPHALLEASGEAVGLPKGVMGNSEVGHINIGSGRLPTEASPQTTRCNTASRT